MLTVFVIDTAFNDQCPILEISYEIVLHRNKRLFQCTIP